MFSLVFPGQGSQTIGMGKDFFENYDLVKDLFKEADESLGTSLSKIILLDQKNSLYEKYFLELKKSKYIHENKETKQKKTVM